MPLSSSSQITLEYQGVIHCICLVHRGIFFFEDYATLLSTLDERHAIVFGRASSCTEPVLVRPNEASKSPGSSSSWTRFRSTNETESGETCSTTVTGMCWRWSGWSRLWKAWPELLHDAADSG